MDKKIAKKTWTLKRIATFGGIALLVGFVLYQFIFADRRSTFKTDKDKLTIATVQRGEFKEFIPQTGTVEPSRTVYLDAIEGGRVEEKYVDDGAIMKKDQPILRLSNTDLELSLSNQETQVFNVLTQMQISKNNADQNTITRLNQMAEVDNAVKEAERVYTVNKKLFGQKAIGLQEYKSSENLWQYQVTRKKLTEDILKKDSVSNRVQLSQGQQSYERMQNALLLMRKKVGDLVVRAPVDGQLTSLDAEIGQSKNKGERLGQLDVLSGFKVRVDVDEHYISRIFTGLRGNFDFAGKNYKLLIKKVYTQVTNGRFQVDMEFENEIPKGIRRGQTLQIRVSLSEEKQALLLPKGGFYQQTGGNWIFKVNEAGTMAYKVDIQLGMQSPDNYEVLNGLQPGDKVITSSYENYGTMQELILKK